MISLLAVFLILISTLIGASGAIFLKKGSSRISIKNPKLILGLFLYALSTVFYITALKFEQLSVLYPILSVGYVWISLFSIRFLKEKMNSLKWAGILFIILGVIFIGLGN